MTARDDAIEAGARAFWAASSVGIDIDRLANTAEPGDTDQDLAIWRSRLVEAAEREVAREIGGAS